MNDEKIKVRVTETRQTLDVVVFSKRADVIEVVIGEGIHNVKCALTPTRNGLAYAGTEWGERSCTSEAASKFRLIPTDLIRPYGNPGGVDYQCKSGTDSTKIVV